MTEDARNKASTEVEVEMDDELFLQLAKLAHGQDITLNQLVSNILREKLDNKHADLPKQHP